MMRLELALVVGILLFCSWCAYIVARMSSSVNVAGQAGQTMPTTTTTNREQELASAGQHQLINQTGGNGAQQQQHSQPILIDHSAAVSELHQAGFGANVGLAQLQQQHQQQLQPQLARQFEASEPVGAKQTHFQWAPYASQQPPPAAPGQHYSQLVQAQPQAGYIATPSVSVPNNRWQAYALPTGAATQASMAYEPQELGASDEDEGAGQADEDPAAAIDEQDPNQTPEQDHDGQQADATSTSTADDDLDYGHRGPQQHQSDGDYEADGGEPDGDDGASAESAQFEPPQSELEEISNRRSFDELESDSRERDKDGHLIVTSRQHLINGKPVGQKQAARRQKRYRKHAQPTTGSGGSGNSGAREGAMSVSKRVKSGRAQEQNKGDGKKVARLTAMATRSGSNLAQDDEDDDDEDAETLEDVEGRQRDDERSGASRGPDQASERDFDHIVHEIDHEDKLRRVAAARAAKAGHKDVPAASQPSGAVPILADQLRQNGASSQQQQQQLATLNATSLNSAQRRLDHDSGGVDSLTHGRPLAPALAPVSAPNQPNAPDAISMETGSFEQRSVQPPSKATTAFGVRADTMNQPRRLKVSSRLAPVPEKEQHEHRLQETLTAQQWDDDSASLPDGGQEAASKEEELRDDEDQDQVANIVQRDDEARQLEQLSRNLLLDSAKVPEELERRKRQTDNGGRDFVAASSLWLDRCQTGDSERKAFERLAPIIAGSNRTSTDAKDNGDGDEQQRYAGSSTMLAPDPLVGLADLVRLHAKPDNERRLDQISNETQPVASRRRADTTGLDWRASDSSGSRWRLKQPNLSNGFQATLHAGEQIPAAVVVAPNGSDQINATPPPPNQKVMIDPGAKQMKTPTSERAASEAPPEASATSKEPAANTTSGPNGSVAAAARHLRDQPDFGEVASPSADLGNYTVKDASALAVGVASSANPIWRASSSHAQSSNNATDVVTGSEDMHVAVLANPPPPPMMANNINNNASNSQQLMMVQPIGAAGPTPVQVPSPVYSLTPTPFSGLPSGQPPEAAVHLASGSHKVAKTNKKKSKHKTKVKKEYAKKKRSKLVDSKYKAAEAYASKKKKRLNKGNMKKKKRKSQRETIAARKHFEGLSKGHKFGHGHKTDGAKKGTAFLKDKGYKKKGFKRSYHKLETGDHKTYFDEFRDKDQKKKWKNFDDKHKYSHKKKWAGYDAKNINKHKLDKSKGNASKVGKWRERADLSHSHEANKYKKSRKSGSMEGSVRLGKSKSRKKKKKKKKKKMMTMKHKYEGQHA